MPRRTALLLPLAVALSALAAPTASAQLPIQPAPPAAPVACNAQAADPRCPNPLVGQSWFVDHEWGAAWRHYRTLRRRGRHGEAALIVRIARHPLFKRFGRWDRGPRAAARKYIARAQEAQPGTVPLISIMRHEGEKCHSRYHGGGARSDRLYRSWLNRFAEGIGSSRVVIAYEPDSMGTIECLSRRRRGARIRLLRWGVALLSKLPNATVYLEAGACDWQPARLMAHKLRRVGVRRIRGFMLNATHFASTPCNIKYGRRVSRMVGGKPFIINTSENGSGGQYRWKRVGKRRKRITVWCNPKTKLGERPSTNTADPKVDAYLWIGRPGYSAGKCNGGPQTGTWWPARALSIARRSGF